MAEYWQAELDRLRELRDNSLKVCSELEYVTDLLATVRARLPEVDQ